MVKLKVRRIAPAYLCRKSGGIHLKRRLCIALLACSLLLCSCTRSSSPDATAAVAPQTPAASPTPAQSLSPDLIDVLLSQPLLVDSMWIDRKGEEGYPIRLCVRNRSDKVVTAFEFVLYVYTPAGKPVKYPNGAYGALVEFTFALQPGQLDDKSYIAVPYTTTQMQRIGLFAPFFKSVTFADGSVWENPQFESLCDRFHGNDIPPDDAYFVPRLPDEVSPTQLPSATP